MTKSIGLLADRVLSVVVPRTTAGACPCSDVYCTRIDCPSGNVKECRTNCDCSVTTCGVCFWGIC
jgi:hypothetical protein